MAKLQLTFTDNNIGKGLERSLRKYGKRLQRAMLLSARDAQQEILIRGRADISSAGNFGRRWTQGLKVNIEEEDDGLIVNTTHQVPYFMVFEKGKVIHGKPLLWIPLSKEYGGDAQGIMARDYPGGLFRVDRKSGKAPLLLSRRTKQPEYFGKRSVTIPKKFHLMQICREVALKMRSFFQRHISR